MALVVTHSVVYIDSFSNLSVNILLTTFAPMTLQEFINTYTGRYIDWDGAYGAQCVDLMRFYQRDVLGVQPNDIPAAGTAKLIYLNFPTNHPVFQKIANTPNNMPQIGDIVFWGTYPFVTGWAGHVAVYTGGNLYNLVTFDQNYPTNSSCHLQRHSYKGVMGWLHKKWPTKPFLPPLTVLRTI